MCKKERTALAFDSLTILMPTRVDIVTTVTVLAATAMLLATVPALVAVVDLVFVIMSVLTLVSLVFAFVSAGSSLFVSVELMEDFRLFGLSS